MYPVRVRRGLMGRIAMAAVVLVLGLATIGGYHAIGATDVVRVSDDIHVIMGQGSNVGVLRTGEGAVVVDTMAFRMQGRRIFELAQELAEGPVQAIINTHYHWDHTRGNPAFPGGIRVISTEKTLAYLNAVDAGHWEGGAEKTLPNETFTDERRLKIGGKTLRLLHPGRGHTDGDLVVLFEEDRVLHTGDLYFNGRYPNIDLEGGGSVQEWVATIDRVLELDFDKVIPGHGPVSDRAGLIAFQGFMRELAAVGTTARRDDTRLAETQRNAVLTADAGYGEMHIPFVLDLDRDFVIRRSWEEAHGAFVRYLPE
jgi:glyoxylase-like metal-dependent hydrolase (beta-lactamase superfamily II)